MGTKATATTAMDTVMVTTGTKLLGRYPVPPGVG